MRRSLAQWLLGLVAWLDPEMPVSLMIGGRDMLSMRVTAGMLCVRGDA